MGQVAINGQRIHFQDTGGDGPAVVLSHGFLMDHQMFAPQVAALSPEFRVITWDERGFGSTEFDGKPFTYWDSARDCLGLLDHLGLGRAVLDTQAGAEDPEQVETYADMLDAWVEVGPGEHLADVVAGLILGEDPAQHAPWIAKWQAWPRERLREPGRCLLERDDIADRLGEITCPALVVHGTADLAIGMDRAEALAAALPDCRGVTQIHDAGHAANLTHPDQVNAALLDFLRNL
jgi:pimeloyl-ACP methyl ester carboxylesterase